MQKYLKYLCLKTAPELGPTKVLELCKLYPDVESFVGNPQHPIYRQGILKQATKAHLAGFVLPPNHEKITALMQAQGIRYVAYPEANYPEKLREIYAAPLILYIKGDLNSALAQKCLAVVGTRKASAYGVEMCKKLLEPLAGQGVCIISGLALGIDTAAHQSALQGGGKTIAVLACGVDKVYPSYNKNLADKIVQNGALISEYEPGTEPERWNFPARNRLVSALSDAVFIVEGPLDSGAMLTAKNALEQNRDIFALPGNINNRNSAGPNHLIKHGAALIQSLEDLQVLLNMEVEKARQTEIFPELSPDEEKLVAIMREEQRTLSFDELLITSGFGIGRLSTQLTNLEIKGLIAKESGNSFFLI
ncbi:MAG: DNA-processing protein DprA [Candidatus Cloacimonetes bacterium]|nr:DNA-processing protein DprA [Candidatus Cloacimonadota bacterium]